MDNLVKLINLKEQRRDLYNNHCWSAQWFSKEEKKKDDELFDQIKMLEANGVFCTCTDCGIADDTVDFTAETPNKMVCEDCSDKLRAHIKDKCGLI